MSGWLVGLVAAARNAVMMPLVVELIKEQTPRIAYQLVRVTAQLLPAAHRDRYACEWAAELDELAGKNVTQLCFAFTRSGDRPGDSPRARVRRLLYPLR
ncbi:hypothetical protein SAMN05216276_107814 [Streptosporangium subroseum]|uniref:Uncharacterized protein n=1 Tax=Streptosporangium subroseum TaxID=106412 RepID=A0A239P0B3_9ACTN|nr:hypothetical protein SAMN05216276_107814 [Streptosporangium subroseum]